MSLILLSASAFAECSTAEWTSTFGNPQALGNDTEPPGLPYEQNCGLTIDSTMTAFPAYVSTDTPDGETEVSVRFYFLADLLDITSGDVTLLRARGGGEVQFEIRLRSTGNVKYLVSLYRDSGGLTEHPDIFPLQDVWQAVEAHWTAGTGDGTFSLKLDDVELYAIAGLTNGSEVIDDVDLGVVNSALATGEAVFDAFMLRRGGQAGLLTVNQLENISTRADVGTVHEIVIGGFVIVGDTDKCVVIRGRGPSVAVPEGETRLPDPVLVLRSPSSPPPEPPIATNDNWGGFPEADIIQSLGLEPEDPLDAAIYVCLPPGDYTPLLTGKGGTTGIGIVEVIDADLGTPFLLNIATRANVLTVNQVAIAGFIVEGDQPKTVLVRARGPSIWTPENQPEGTTELSDPFLRLQERDTKVVLRTNARWQSAPNADDIASSGFAPEDPFEAAILLDLPPGPYTATVEGFGGVTGIGLIEVYDLSGGAIAAQ
jgi:hypothetical protein